MSDLKKKTCSWIEVDGEWVTGCGSPRNCLPVTDFSYCPFCGGWLALLDIGLIIIDEASDVDWSNK